MKILNIIRLFKKESLERLFILTAGFCMILYGRWTIMGSPPIFQQIDNPASFLTMPFERVNKFIIFFLLYQFVPVKYLTFFQFINYSYIYLINIWIMICPVWLCFDWSMGCVSLIYLNTFPKDPRLFIVFGFWAVLVLIFYKILFSKNYDKKYVI